MNTPTREWRKANPDWRKRQRLAPKIRRAVTPKIARAIISSGLQDLNADLIALMIGIVSRLGKIRLPDEIDEIMRCIMVEGWAILHGTDNIKEPP